MNRQERMIAARVLAKENQKWPRNPKSIPKVDWPYDNETHRIGVWRSKDYLIQAYQEDNGIIRLSVNRTQFNRDGRWMDNITWDELQLIKSAVGYGEFFAVEIYPADGYEVNVANMRHIWILPEPPSFAWMK